MKYLFLVTLLITTSTFASVFKCSGINESNETVKASLNFKSFPMASDGITINYKNRKITSATPACRLTQDGDTVDCDTLPATTGPEEGSVYTYHSMNSRNGTLTVLMFWMEEGKLVGVISHNTENEEISAPLQNCDFQQ